MKGVCDSGHEYFVGERCRTCNPCVAWNVMWGNGVLACVTSLEEADRVEREWLASCRYKTTVNTVEAYYASDLVRCFPLWVEPEPAKWSDGAGEKQWRSVFDWPNFCLPSGELR